MPLLFKYGLSASFGVVGNWISDKPKITKEEGGLAIKRFSFTEAKKLIAMGNEISAHGKTHRPNLTRLPIDSIVAEFRDVKQYLEKNLNVPIYAFHYPYTEIRDKSEQAVKKTNYYVARIGGDIYNSPNTYTPFRISSFVILNDTTPSLSYYKSLFDHSQNKWLVFMYHHIFRKTSKEIRIFNKHNIANTYAVTPATFERHMRIIRNSGLWVAPLSVVARYFDERKQAKIILHQSERSCSIKINGIKLSPSMQVPLTLGITLPWEWIRVAGSLYDGIYQIKDNQIFLDIMPEQEILIEKLESQDNLSSE